MLTPSGRQSANSDNLPPNPDQGESAGADIHQVIFYPVGNGDTTQIILSKGRRVLFDFCHRDKAEDADTPEIDLKARLKEDLKAANRVLR